MMAASIALKSSLRIFYPMNSEENLIDTKKQGALHV